MDKNIYTEEDLHWSRGGNTEALTFDNLLQNGVNGNIQGGMTITGKLLQHVQENF